MFIKDSWLVCVQEKVRLHVAAAAPPRRRDKITRETDKHMQINGFIGITEKTESRWTKELFRASSVTRGRSKAT